MRTPCIALPVRQGTHLPHISIFLTPIRMEKESIMSDKPEKNQIEPQSDPLMDTQWLLGSGTPAEGSFALEDILAEFSPAEPGQAPREPAPAPEPEAPVSQPETTPVSEPPAQEVRKEPPAPPRWKKRWGKKPVVPPPLPPEPDSPPEEPAAETSGEMPAVTEEMLDEAFFADMLAPPSVTPPETVEETSGQTEPPAPDAAAEADTTPVETDGTEDGEAGGPEPPDRPEPPQEAPSPPDAQADAVEGVRPVPLEAIENLMADTVDAVKEEQAERLRRHLEKARKAVTRSLARKETSIRKSVPDVEDEPLPSERAMWNKRRWRDCRKSLHLTALVTMVLWLPWLLGQFGIAVPFFSDSGDNAALCVLVPHAIVTILSWPVFRAAMECLREKAWSLYATAALCTAVTLLDEMTLLLLPERVDAAPLGGLASMLLVFTLWGLTGLHRGCSESLRTIAMGEPTRVVDRCGTTIAKGQGSRRGFYTRLSMEDSPAQWQRLLLPVLALASVIFAALSSVGRGHPQDFFWCWSVILCSASSLVFPLAYSVPFGRLALRLSRSGTALAGQHGAAVLASTRRLAVTDEDLFPQNTATVGKPKLYGEEQNKAISYVATLAVQAGGHLGRIFGDICRNERISFQGVEHFHIHDDGGLSGVIRGETVLVGTPTFLRHKAVRLPGSMPSKTCVCLAVDGELAAVFSIKYTPNDTVEYALRCLRRNGLQITLATRDSNIGLKLMKERFGVSGNVQHPDLSERLTLSDPERDAEEPNALIYREGILQLASLAIGSSRLCQTALVGNLLSIFSSVAGILLGFYLTFTGSVEVLTPVLLLTYLLLWVTPMLPLVWTVDKL